MDYRTHKPHTFKSATRPILRFKLHTSLCHHWEINASVFHVVNSL